MREEKIGIILAVLGAAMFGLKSIFIKLAFAQGTDAATLLALRMLIAVPLYLIVLWWALRQSTTSLFDLTIKDIFTILLLGFLGYFLASILDFEGLNHISAQLERLTLFTYPVMVALLNWLFFREKITFRLWVSLLFTYLGVSFLFAFESGDSSTQVTKGITLVALAAFSFSIYVIFSKGYIQRLGSLIFTSIAMVSSTFFVLLYFFTDHDLSDLNVNLTTWGFAALLGIVSTLIPSFMLSEAISRIGSTKTSIAGTIGPVFTVMLAVTILGEDFGWAHLIGMLMVIAGVLFLAKK
ncbi:MAG: DMT family transporter [Thiotrichaceae bacterium]|nr:DMT family transporter [Thiotrichaceae bacterium]